MLVGLVCPSAITMLLAGNDFDPAIFASATDYVSLIFAAAVPILLFDILGTFAMLEGADRYMQTASVVLLLSNIVGDLVVVRLKAGMAGIAAATGFSYFCAGVIVVSFFLGKHSMFRLKLRWPDARTLLRTIAHGLPMVVKGLCGILWPMSVNRLMLRYGTITGLAALSIQDAVRYLPTALCSGIASATLIMVGIYAGEQDEEGMRRLNLSIVRWSLIGGLSIATCLSLAAEPLLRLFTSDAEILSLSVSALRLYLVGVPCLALNLAASSYLQGLGLNSASAIVIFVDHILISISSAFFLARLFGTMGIFASYGTCEVIMAALLALNALILFFLRRQKSSDAATTKKTELRRSIQSVEDAVAASLQVNQFCLSNGVSTKDAHHIALCAEDLAVNSIEHGFTDGKKHHLEMRAVIVGGKLLLRFRDDGWRFDLVERYKMINPEDPTRSVGLRIVFSNAEDVSYSSAFSVDNVCVRYAVGA